MFAKQRTTGSGDINLGPLGHRISNSCNIPILNVLSRRTYIKKDMQVAFLKEKKRPVVPSSFFSGLLWEKTSWTVGKAAEDLSYWQRSSEVSYWKQM